MGTFDPRFDIYIDKAAAYAQPVLIHVRNLIHQTVPGVVETIKWGHPHFDYKGPFMSMAAFKQHLGVNFWKAPLMDDAQHIFKEAEQHSAGSIGKISGLADLPADNVLIAYIRNAAQLNDLGVKLPAKKEKPAEKKELTTPDYLIEAFKANTAAMQNFEKFSPSAKKEYLEWLAEAKTEATRQSRLATMLEWVAEGKTRHWKYKK